MTNGLRAETRRVSTVLPFAFATLLAASAAIAQEASTLAQGETPTPEGGVSLHVNVVAKQLDIARQQIQPSLGATVYDFGREAIETQPQGDNQPFNRLLLQAPGVAQDVRREPEAQQAVGPHVHRRLARHSRVERARAQGWCYRTHHADPGRRQRVEGAGGGV